MSTGSAQTNLVQIPTLTHTSLVTLGKALLPGVGSFFSKSRLITTALQGYCEDSSIKYGELRLVTVMAILLLRTLPPL